MKILFLVSDISLPRGVERVVCVLANYFVKKNLEVEILSVRNSKGYINYTLDSKVKVNFLNVTECNSRFKSFLLKIKILVLAKSYILKNKPDIVYSQIIKTLALIKTRQIYTIGAIHTSIEETYNKKNIILRFLIRKLFSWVDLLITLTNDQADKLKIINSKIKVETIPNFLDYYPTSLAKLENKKIVLVGGLLKIKGYERFLSVWKDLQDEYQDWQIEIYGEGNDRNNLQSIIEKNNLNIKLMGVTDNVVEKYQDSSIFVLSSLSEGFPMTILEAMSCGLPCISFDINSGPRDLIKNGETGFLIPDGNLDDMKDKLCLLLDDENLRKKFGQAGCLKSREFSVNVIGQQWLKLIEDIKTKRI